MSSFPVSFPVAKPKLDHFCKTSPNMTVFVSGYVEMRLGSHSDKFSPPKGTKSFDKGYLEMRPVVISKSSGFSNSPIKLKSSPRPCNTILAP